MTNAAPLGRTLPKQGVPIRVLGLLLTIPVAILIPHVLPTSSTIAVLAQALMFGMFALGIGFLHKFNGRLSFGHATWFGLSGYSLAMLVHFTSIPIEFAILIVIVAVSVLAIPLGLIVARIPGVPFGMLTLAVCQAFFEVVNRWHDLAGGTDGMMVSLPETIFGVSSTDLQTPSIMFSITWCVIVILVLFWKGFENSSLGQLALAIRENEERVRFLGFHTLNPRVIVFVISAGISGLAGILFVLYASFISPEALAFTTSAQAMIMAIIGGTELALGPVIGAVLFFLLRDQFGMLTDHWMLLLGVCLILVIVGCPTGVTGGTIMLWRYLRRLR